MNTILDPSAQTVKTDYVFTPFPIITRQIDWPVQYVKNIELYPNINHEIFSYSNDVESETWVNRGGVFA